MKEAGSRDTETSASQPFMREMFQLKQLRHRYVLCSKHFPRLYDISRSITRPFDPSHLHRFLRAYSRLNPAVHFLQIGANDGMRNDPIREFVVAHAHWSGCFVEPIPHHFAQLVRNYSRIAKRRQLRFENIAIGERQGSIELWSVHPDHRGRFPDYVEGMVTFDRDHFQRHFDFSVDSAWLRAEEVPCCSVASLVDSLKEPPDLVVIDVEGMELEILRSFPWQTTHPRCFIFETCHHSGPDQAIVARLFRANGYGLHTVESDSIAVSEVWLEQLRQAPEQTADHATILTSFERQG